MSKKPWNVASKERIQRKDHRQDCHCISHCAARGNDDECNGKKAHRRIHCGHLEIAHGKAIRHKKGVEANSKAHDGQNHIISQKAAALDFGRIQQEDQTQGKAKEDAALFHAGKGINAVGDNADQRKNHTDDRNYLFEGR